MIGTSSITKVLKTAVSSSIGTPAKAISGIILLCGLLKRPGFSTILALASIAEKMGVLGLPTSSFPDGTPNEMLQYTSIVVDEVFKQIRERMSLNVAIAPGSITVQAGPYTGTNINVVTGTGCAL